MPPPKKVEGRNGARKSTIDPNLTFLDAQWANDTQASVEISPPSLRSVLVLSFAGYVLFVTVISLCRNYFAVVDNFGDNYSYMAIASAIRSWDFQDITVKHFWGLPYAVAALSLLIGTSVRAALLLISLGACLASVTLAHRLWGGWIAGFFAVLNFAWLQHSFLGGSEPLFLSLLFGTFIAVRNNYWLMGTLLASVSTVVRPMGLFALFAIGVVLLWRREFRTFVLASLVGLTVGGLYIVPLAIYFGNPLANMGSYQTDWDNGIPIGWPFYAIVKGTIVYPVPWTNLLFTYGWIILVLLAAVAMIVTRRFHQFARTFPVESLFAATYLAFLYTYNSSYMTRGNFPRFALPIIPLALVALDRWIPKDQRVLWIVGFISPILAAASAIGIRNVVSLIYH
jgi:hypothetical protein